jgi:hypothetical protein
MTVDIPKEAVENVAQALYAETAKNVPDRAPWNKIPKEARSAWRHRARVAIIALSRYANSVGWQCLPPAGVEVRSVKTTSLPDGVLLVMAGGACTGEQFQNANLPIGTFVEIKDDKYPTINSWPGLTARSRA